MPESIASTDANYRDAVRAYWDETTRLYLRYGTTFQGGFVLAPGADASPEINNLFLASRAGIRPGDRVLDAGCGVCGPGIDIVRTIERVTIDAVTLSPVQALTAAGAVHDGGYSDRIRIHVCDYHQLPFADAVFDVVIFFESLYSVDPLQLFREVHRVLRPGGRVYAKEVFRQEGEPSAADQMSIEEFETVFQYKLRTIRELADSLRGAGFTDVDSQDLSDRISSDHYFRANVEIVFGFPLPTEFGRRHHREFTSAVLSFGEVRGRKPV